MAIVLEVLTNNPGNSTANVWPSNAVRLFTLHSQVIMMILVSA